MVYVKHLLVIFTLLKLCFQRIYSHNLNDLKNEVQEMFDFAFNNYMKNAYPYDELRPLTCDGFDTWGGFSLTLIDSLDTLVILNRKKEFKEAVDLVLRSTNIDRDKNVSVFETNIRVVGGLLSAHLLSKKGGLDLEPGWPCNGALLRLAENVARKLLPAFNTSTGMPYGTVNLRYGVPRDETPITCTAGVGTFIVEFGALSRLIGDPVFEKVAMRALRAMWNTRSNIGLVGNHIDVQTGKWTAIESGIGSGIDSYFEYLVKGSVLFRNQELRGMFDEYLTKIRKYIEHNDWHFWVKMDKGSLTQANFQSLEAFWPGLLTMVGDINGAVRSLHNYHQVWKMYGFTPEVYNVAQSETMRHRSSYPLRPELAESIMYVYRATKDPTVLQMGIDIMRSIQINSRVSCGFATIYDVRTHQIENRMESFFLSETLKYLYLLFDENNFIHAGTSAKTSQYFHATFDSNDKKNSGDNKFIDMIATMSGGECIIGAGGYIFNSEAHPIDPGALYCCHGYNGDNDFQGNSNNEASSDGYQSDLVKLDKMHRYYPLLKLLNVSDAELSLGYSKDGSIEEEIAIDAILAQANEKSYQKNKNNHNSYDKNNIDSELNEEIKQNKFADSNNMKNNNNLNHGRLACSNTKLFQYRFVFYGQVFDDTTIQ